MSDQARAAPLRVAHAIQGVTTQAGGPTTAFLALVDAVAGQAGVEVRAFSARPPEDDPIRDRLSSAPEGRFTLTSAPGRIWPGGIARALIPEIRGGRFDVVHLHGLWCRDYLPIMRAAERAGTTVVVQPHGMLIHDALLRSRMKKRVFLAAGLRRRLSHADLIVCATDHERLSSWIPKKGDRQARAEVIALPVEPPPGDAATLRAEGRELLEIEPEAPAVVFLGRLHPVKRIELLIDALAASRRAPTLALVGAGDEAYVASLRERAAKKGVDASRLRWPGWLNGREKWAALAAGDAVVLCSIHENFGYTVPEAASLGVAGVLTANLSLAEEMDQAGAGWVAKPSPEGLGEAIDRALSANDPASVEARRAWVDRAFSGDAVGRAMVEAYRSCR